MHTWCTYSITTHLGILPSVSVPSSDHSRVLEKDNGLKEERNTAKKQRPEGHSAALTSYC